MKQFDITAHNIYNMKCHQDIQATVKGKVNSRHIQRLATIRRNAEVNESKRVQNHETAVASLDSTKLKLFSPNQVCK